MAKGTTGSEELRVSRWTSRRFLLAVAGLLVSVLVILGKLAPEKTDAELADYNDFLRDLSGATAPRMPQPTRSDHAPVSTTPVTQSPHPPR